VILDDCSFINVDDRTVGYEYRGSDYRNGSVVSVTVNIKRSFAAAESKDGGSVEQYGGNEVFVNSDYEDGARIVGSSYDRNVTIRINRYVG
jgi:hypothetical protein